MFLSGVQQVRLDHNGKLSNADIHGVHSENGLVLSEELGKKYVFFS
jgi:OTU domain-containing protein 4